MTRIATLLWPTVLAVLLSGCGGGGNAEMPAAVDPLAQLPSSANQSSAGLVGYIGAMAAAPSEGREPVSVDNFNPPLPENTEPEPVDG